MNEKIKKLAIQAGFEYDPRDCNFYHGDSAQYLNKELIKFAELIVGECAEFVFVLDAEPVSHKSAARMLLKHFGVK